MRCANRVLEEQREVVNYSIAPPDLLHELRRSSQHHSSEMLGLSIGEERTERSDSALMARSSNTIHDDVSFESCFFIIHTISSQRRDYFSCFFMAILCQQPTWRLWKPDHAKEQDRTKHTLKSDWEAPSQLIRAVGASEVDPVCDERSESDNSALNTDK
jgi:hypothetical protein